MKHFRAHLGPISGLCVSTDGLLLCSASVDQTFKIYDVINFGLIFIFPLRLEDMINMIKLSYVPFTCEFIFRKGSAQPIIAW